MRQELSATALLTGAHAALPGVELKRVERSRSLQRRIKEHCTLAWVVSGRVQTWRRGGTRSYQAGAIIVSRPGDVHADRKIDEPVSYSITAFAPERVLAARAALAAGHSPVLDLDELDEGAPEAALVRRMHRALYETACSQQRQEELVSETLIALLRLSSRGKRSSAADPPRSVVRAQEYMRAHLSDSLCLDEIAQAAALDPFRLIRAFRTHVGLSPYEWLTHVRVQQAKALLAQGSSAVEVAQRLGYCDQSQLHRHFRRIVGTTPGAYARTFR
jgi:AraC-like DNA-binding protein